MRVLNKIHNAWNILHKENSLYKDVLIETFSHLGLLKSITQSHEVNMCEKVFLGQPWLLPDKALHFVNVPQLRLERIFTVLPFNQANQNLFLI